MTDANNLTVHGLALAQQKSKLEIGAALKKVCKEFNEATGLYITEIGIDMLSHRVGMPSGQYATDGAVVIDINLKTNIHEHVR